MQILSGSVKSAICLVVFIAVAWLVGYRLIKFFQRYLNIREFKNFLIILGISCACGYSVMSIINFFLP